MVDFAKFNKSFDVDGLKADIEDVSKNGGGDYKEVPAGNYEVTIKQAELKESKTGLPMVSIWFQVVAGEFKNSIIFYNQVVHKGFGIHNCNELLRSLETPDLAIEFNDFEQYADLILDVAEKNEGTVFGIKYGRNAKDFPTFEITDVFED